MSDDETILERFRDEQVLAHLNREERPACPETKVHVWANCGAIPPKA